MAETLWVTSKTSKSCAKEVEVLWRGRGVAVHESLDNDEGGDFHPVEFAVTHIMTGRAWLTNLPSEAAAKMMGEALDAVCDWNTKGLDDIMRDKALQAECRDSALRVYEALGFKVKRTPPPDAPPA
jgi:hypothetical protein